jgi:DNA-binding MarR family transcriptional regulator
MSTPPLPEGLNDDRRSNAANRLHSVAIHLLRHVRTVDSEAGLTPARLAALSVLVFGGPKTISELAEVEMVSVPAITRLVKALEAVGLADRSAGDDRRVVIVSATDTAHRLMEQARRRRLQKFRDLLEPLSDAQVGTLEDAASLLEKELATWR